VTDQQTQLGKIQISPQAIATLTRQTVLEVYGVVGLAGKTRFDDWRHGWLRSRNSHHGVEVQMVEEGVVLISTSSSNTAPASPKWRVV